MVVNYEATANQQETKNTRLNWLQDFKRLEAKEVGRGNSYLTLYYNQELSEEQKERLRVKERMPFKVILSVSAEQRAKIEDQESRQTELENIFKGATLNFFFHGWASNPEVWDAQFLRRSLYRFSPEQKAIVNILPCGMGIDGGGCRTDEGKDFFTPENYGQQISDFVDLSFGWENKINLIGHSMGGIGSAWAGLKIIQNQEFRKKDGSVPDLRLWMIAPAYPAEANTFIKTYLENAMAALSLLPESMRFLGAPVAMAINRNLLPKSPNERHQIHTGVAITDTETVVQTMNGLKRQRPFTWQEWQQIINQFPVLILTNPGDKIVSQSESLVAFNQLTNKVVNQQGFKNIQGLPLMLTEEWVPTTADHYASAMSNDQFYLQLTQGPEKVESPLLALPAFLNRIPQDKVRQAAFYLWQELRSIKHEFEDQRESKKLERVLNLLAFTGTKINPKDLPPEDSPNERVYMRIQKWGKRQGLEANQTATLVKQSLAIEGSILKYYKMVWSA